MIENKELFWWSDFCSQDTTTEAGKLAYDIHGTISIKEDRNSDES